MPSTMIPNFIEHRSFVNNLLIVLLTSCLLVLSAWVSLPLGFTPVPISFTAQLVLLFAAFLGKRGAYATWIYLAQGAMGLPVFANGGCGIAYLLGPTGGYLIGFALAAYVVAVFSEKVEKTPSKIFGILLFGNSLICHNLA